MIIDFEYEHEADKKLIDDIVPAKAEPHVDVHNEDNVMQPIGVLEEQYLRSRMAANHLRHQQPRLTELDLMEPVLNNRFERVPPLQTLRPLYAHGGQSFIPTAAAGISVVLSHWVSEMRNFISQANRATRRRLAREFNRLKGAMTVAALAVVNWFHSLDDMLRRPKRYTARHGVETTRPRLANRAILAIPAALVVLFIAITIIAGTLSTSQPGGSGQSQQGSGQSHVLQSNGTASDNNGGGSGSGGSNSSKNSPGHAPATNATLSPVGGSSSGGGTGGTTASGSSGSTTTQSGGGLGGGSYSGGGTTSQPVISAPAPTQSSPTPSQPIISNPTPTSPTPSSPVPTTTVTVPPLSVGLPGSSPIVSTGGTSLSL